ncbi:MAG: hypothetical protein CMO10_05170 [Thalassospira sp.]|nr:hypothetical protein [Thalassospira sp.]
MILNINICGIEAVSRLDHCLAGEFIVQEHKKKPGINVPGKFIREASRLGDVGNLGKIPVPDIVPADETSKFRKSERSRFVRLLTTYDVNIGEL